MVRKFYECRFLLDAEYPYADGNELAAGISDALGMFQLIGDNGGYNV